MSDDRDAAGSARVGCTVSDGVAEVVLDRPDKLNALDAATFEQLVDVADRLAGDGSVRAVVLRGAGRAFCAGLDVSLFSGAAPGLARDLERRLPGRVANLVQQACWGWRELPVPVVAALHGAVLGGGLQLALAADVRIVGPDARLSVLEVRWGLVPDMTGTWTLPRLVGPDVAKELTWTGRLVGADEAVSLGLATSAAEDPLAAARDLARRVAGANPDAVRAAKALIDASGRDPAAQLLAESRAMASIVGSPNQREAVAAQVEQRPARFADRGMLEVGGRSPYPGSHDD